MPLTVLNGETSFEKLFGIKPNYEHLKVFSCLCYAISLKRDRHKFLPKAHQSVFLENSTKKKGYKIYIIETKAVSISKDVFSMNNSYPLIQKIFIR